MLFSYCCFNPWCTYIPLEFDLWDIADVSQCKDSFCFSPPLTRQPIAGGHHFRGGRRLLHGEASLRRRGKQQLLKLFSHISTPDCLNAMMEWKIGLESTKLMGNRRKVFSVRSKEWENLPATKQMEQWWCTLASGSKAKNLFWQGGEAMSFTAWFFFFSSVHPAASQVGATAKVCWYRKRYFFVPGQGTLDVVFAVVDRTTVPLNLFFGDKENLME